jgi:hypothetical protein
MALLFFEGFDAYGTVAQHNQQANSSAAGAIDTSIVRTGRAAMRLGSSGTFARVVSVSGSTVVVGMGVNFSSHAAGNRFLRLVANGAGAFGLIVETDSVGRVRVLAPNGGAPIWTDTDTQPLGTWLYFEFKVNNQSGATGSWTLRRNGQVLQTQSSVVTLASAGHTIDGMSAQAASGLTFYLDDIYILDGSGSALNDFLGPVRARTLLPTANASVAMTPNTGANWDAVNDTTPDDDTTYVSAATAPLTDRYTLADLPPEASIIRAVRSIYRARKEDAATVELRSVLLSGATETTGAARALDTAYAYYTDYFPTDPNTAAAWTPAAVDALTAGVRRVT